MNLRTVPKWALARHDSGNTVYALVLARRNRMAALRFIGLVFLTSIPLSFIVAVGATVVATKQACGLH
jgi:hypothetical protein